MEVVAPLDVAALGKSPGDVAADADAAHDRSEDVASVNVAARASVGDIAAEEAPGGEGERGPSLQTTREESSGGLGLRHATGGRGRTDSDRGAVSLCTGKGEGAGPAIADMATGWLRGIATADVAASGGKGGRRATAVGEAT